MLSCSNNLHTSRDLKTMFGNSMMVTIFYVIMKDKSCVQRKIKKVISYLWIVLRRI